MASNTSIVIPAWLKNRPIDRNDFPELQEAFAAVNHPCMGDLTLQTLKKYHQRFPGKPFYRLARILGFYGVQFTGDPLSHFSGPPEPFPLVLNIPEQHWPSSCAISDANLAKNVLALGIQRLKQLHGVPIRSFHQWTNQEISPEIAGEWFQAALVVAHTGLFDPPQPPNLFEKEVPQNSEAHFSPQEELLQRPVSILNLSVRSTNCLQNARIFTMGDLVQKTNEELKALPHLGRKSLFEICIKLRNLGLHLGMRLTPEQINILQNENIPEFSGQSFFEISKDLAIDFSSEEVLSNLNRALDDFPLSVRSRNVLEEKKIHSVWQLLLCNENELKQTRNAGRKTIEELKQVVESLGFQLGMSLTPEQNNILPNKKHENIPTFSGQQLFEISKDLANDSLDFLKDNQREIVKERIWKGKGKQTLAALAQRFGVTRERVRQIEKKTCQEIQQRFRRELRESTKDLRHEIEELGGVANLNDLPFSIDLSAQEQTIVNRFLEWKKSKIHIDWEYCLVSSRGKEAINILCDAIKQQLQTKISPNSFFARQDLEQAVRSVVQQKGLFQHRSYVNLMRRFRKEELSEIEGQFCFGRLTKQDKNVLAFKKLFPQGLEIYKERELLREKFIEFDPAYQHTNPRAIEGRLIEHEDILLWGRGFVIHREHAKFDGEVIKQVVAWIRQKFEQGLPRFRVYRPYQQFEATLNQSGIPNPYALYSALRLHNDHRIGQRKFPTLVDLESNVDLNERVLEEVENYFLEIKRAVSARELKNEFLTERGWQEYQLQLTLGHSNAVFHWKDGSYVHREYLEIDEEKLEAFIEELFQKLQSMKGDYSLSLHGVQLERGVLWEEVCPSATTQTMTKLILSDDRQRLAVRNSMVSLNSREFISVAKNIEDFALEKQAEVTLEELKKQFCSQLGWTDNQFNNALPKSELFKTGNRTYLHPSFIQWNESLALAVCEVLQACLNESTDPHGRLSEVIEEDNLPRLPNEVEWSCDLLKSSMKTERDFIFFDDAYVAGGNEQQIEGWDGMVAFLIAKNFPLNIVKQEKLQKLLWREGILQSGRSLPKNELFFEGSAVEYLEPSEEVKLSEFGKKRYGNK